MKVMTDRKNLERITLMENMKEKTITILNEFSLAPHLNYTTTSKVSVEDKIAVTWLLFPPDWRSIQDEETISVHHHLDQNV